jgi:hypothetical protein
MKEKDYLEAIASLEEQRIRVTASKEASKKFLVDAGVWHLLVKREGVIYDDDDE